MNFIEIEKLLAKGFTPEQIMTLNTTTESNNAAEESKSEKSDSEPNSAADNDVPKWAENLNNSITGLQRTMQAMALANTQINQPKNVDEAANEALAALIIDPPKKGE